MKLEQLAQVVEVANTQSISKAAENLLLSQPGLSASVRQLENELGTDLFIRNKKGVELTDLGSSFVVYAKKILEQVEDLEELCKGNVPQPGQTLSVAACHFRYAGVALAMMLRKHRRDGARFVMRSGVTDECIDWVAEGICDVGLVYFNTGEEKEFRKRIARKQLSCQILYEAEARAMIGRGHPLYATDAEQIDAMELLQYPMIAQDQTAAKDYFRSVFLRAAQDNIRAIVTDHAAMYEMLEFSDGYCMGLTNDIIYRNIPRHPGTRDLKIQYAGRPIRRSVAWVTSADGACMPLAGEFMRLVTQLCTCPDFWEKNPQWKASF